jgi:hypothetical protein
MRSEISRDALRATRAFCTLLARAHCSGHGAQVVFGMRKNVLGTDVTDAGILRSLRDVLHHAVVAVDQAARGRSVRTTVQFGGTQTDLYSGVAEDSSTLVPPASKLILDASGVPVVPFSPADPGIAAVDWISVDENGYLVVEAKAGWG